MIQLGEFGSGEAAQRNREAIADLATNAIAGRLVPLAQKIDPAHRRFVAGTPLPK